MMAKKAKATKPAGDPHAPSLGLLVRLGSIAVHADEFLSSDGHAFDRTSIELLLKDPEVVAWIEQMGPLLPRKRSS